MPACRNVVCRTVASEEVCSTLGIDCAGLVQGMPSHLILDLCGSERAHSSYAAPAAISQSEKNYSLGGFDSFPFQQSLPTPEVPCSPACAYVESVQRVNTAGSAGACKQTRESRAIREFPIWCACVFAGRAAADWLPPFRTILAAPAAAKVAAAWWARCLPLRRAETAVGPRARGRTRGRAAIKAARWCSRLRCMCWARRRRRVQPIALRLLRVPRTAPTCANISTALMPFQSA